VRDGQHGDEAQTASDETGRVPLHEGADDSDEGLASRAEELGEARHRGERDRPQNYHTYQIEQAKGPDQHEVLLLLHSPQPYVRPPLVQVQNVR